MTFFDSYHAGHIDVAFDVSWYKDTVVLCVVFSILRNLTHWGFQFWGTSNPVLQMCLSHQEGQLSASKKLAFPVFMDAMFSPSHSLV